MEAKDRDRTPTADSMLAKLIDLYADQKGVKVTYIITDKEDVDNALHG